MPQARRQRKTQNQTEEVMQERTPEEIQELIASLGLSPAELMAAGYINSRSLLDTGWQIRQTIKDGVDARKANREQLRQLAEQRLLSDSEMMELEELYPPRGTTKDGDETNGEETELEESEEQDEESEEQEQEEVSA